MGAYSIRLSIAVESALRLDFRSNTHPADGGGRTHTLLPVLDFESSASANSATSALMEEAITSASQQKRKCSGAGVVEEVQECKSCKMGQRSSEARRFILSRSVS